MNIFTIDRDNNITVHATKKAARESGADVFDTAEGFADLIGADSKRTIEIWNSLTGVTPVKKFASRTIAARRIFAELQRLIPPSPSTAAVTAEAEQPSPKKPVKKAGKKATAEPKTGGKREVLLNLTSRKNGASLEELMAALGWQKHSVRGFIATLGKTTTIESFKTEKGVRTYRTQAG